MRLGQRRRGRRARAGREQRHLRAAERRQHPRQGVGIAYQAGSSSANSAISVIVSGIWAAVAGGTITRGDVLVVGGTTGTVISASISTPPTRPWWVSPRVRRVGRVRRGADRGPPRSAGTVMVFTANGAITANRIVVASTGAKVAMPGAPTPRAA